MRISGAINSIELNQVNATSSSNVDVTKQGSEMSSKWNNTNQSVDQLDNSEATKNKVKEVVTKMNEMLDVTNNTSKFTYHEGLDRYYVSVVDRETEEVVKEIPPKKLLDAFYEMQKMLGMIVDEKI